MDVSSRVERALRAALDPMCAPGAPPRLAAAVYHSVFPAGARIRPQLCIRVAMAIGEDSQGLADGAAAAIELVHCASLVHDDLPCFDAASTRRGQPSTHRAFGEPLAVLAGDQLIVLAFETLARASTPAPLRLARLVTTLARATGLPHGIIAGQGWESEPTIPTTLYRRAKTGALFEAATLAGAIAAGAEDPETWRTFGQRIGEAYQVADDLLDLLSNPTAAGKPTGRDASLNRPNVATDLGITTSTRLFEQLAQAAIEAIPTCENQDTLIHFTKQTIDRIRQRAQIVENNEGVPPLHPARGSAP